MDACGRAANEPLSF